MRSVLWGVLTWCLAVGSANAVVVDDLYEVGIVVPDRTSVARMEALPGAMAQVIARVSGRSDIDPQMSADQVARDYLEGYSYQTLDDDAGLELQAQFRTRQINEYLAQRQLPVWGSHRPEVLAWIGLVTDSGRVMLDESSREEASAEAAFERLALPVVFPTGDLEDSMALPVGRLFGMFRSDIRKASERYESPAVLAIRVMPVAQQWRADGYLTYGTDSQSLSQSAVTAEQAIAAVAAKVAEYFSSRFGVVASLDAPAGDAELLTIRGITSFADYQQFMRLVAGVSGVAGVAVNEARDDELTLAVSLKASWQQVLANIVLDRRVRKDAETGELTWTP